MKGEDAENQQICGSQHLLFFLMMVFTKIDHC